MNAVNHRFTASGLALALALTLSSLALAEGPKGGKAEPKEQAWSYTRADLPGPVVPEEATLPPGTKADVLLWKLAMDSANDVTIQRTQAERLLRRFTGEKTDALLLARVKLEQGAEQKRIHQVRQRLGVAWKGVAEVMASRWPVDPRINCRPFFHDLEGAMHGGPGAAGVAEARVGIKACLKKLDTVLVPLRKANAQLVAAFAEADQALAPPATDGGQGG